MNQLKAEGLKKRYKSRTVVKDVSMEVNSGEVVGLLGPNGAGKTTCFYMMVGLVPLDGGNISLDSQNLSRMPIHRRARLGLSYLPQEASIFRKLTVAENIQAILELQDLSPEQIENQLDGLLHELHIGHLRDSQALSLSNSSVSKACRSMFYAARVCTWGRRCRNRRILVTANHCVNQFTGNSRTIHGQLRALN